jgi:hypothetical protein
MGSVLMTVLGLRASVRLRTRTPRTEKRRKRMKVMASLTKKMEEAVMGVGAMLMAKM